MAGKVDTHYIVFKGDDIVFATASLEQAEKEFNKLPEPKRPSQEVAIYKLVKEKKYKRDDTK